MVSTLRLGPALALCLVSLTGCARLHVDDGRHVDERLSTLEQEEEIRRARLAELELQISSAEQRVAAAKADAQFQECRATQTKLAAEIEIAKADCVRVVAERGACVAKNESRTAKGAGLGCAAGWVTAFLTGGAAAPLVVAGCAGGAVLSHGTRDECGEVPACANRQDLDADVLRANGYSSMPACKRPSIAPEPAMKPARDPYPVASVEPPRVGHGRAASPKETCQAWRIDRIEFTVPEQRHDGTSWDGDGSAPELVYTVLVGGRRAYRSPKQEAYGWEHTPPTPIRLAPGQEVSIDLIDWDVVGRERIAAFQGTLPQDLVDPQVMLTSGRATASMRLTCASE